jgi:hypothetical protein
MDLWDPKLHEQNNEGDLNSENLFESQ